MSLYMPWQTGTIANNGTSTGEIDLQNNCELMQVILPALTSGTIKVTVSDTTGGTFQDLGSGVTTPATTGAYSTMFRIGGYRYVKVVSGTSQGAARSIKVRGVKL